MKLKDFNLVYYSDQIEIRSIKKEDIPVVFDLWKSTINEEYANTATEDELIDDLCHSVFKNMFGHSVIFLVFKNNNFEGYFDIWHDSYIKFNVNNYRKDVYNLSFHFLETVNNNSISRYMRIFMEAILNFKLKVKTIFSFKMHHNGFEDAFIDNNFEELQPELFHSKLSNFMKKNGLNDDYRTSNIFIKNIK